MEKIIYKSKETEYMFEMSTIIEIKFLLSVMEISYVHEHKVKTLVLPKLEGFKLRIG